MIAWQDAGAVDGFTIMGSTLPYELAAFVDHVVPILQRRGRFRTEYTGARCATTSDFSGRRCGRARRVAESPPRRGASASVVRPWCFAPTIALIPARTARYCPDNPSTSVLFIRVRLKVILYLSE